MMHGAYNVKQYKYYEHQQISEETAEEGQTN